MNKHNKRLEAAGRITNLSRGTISQETYDRIEAVGSYKTAEKTTKLRELCGELEDDSALVDTVLVMPLRVKIEAAAVESEERIAKLEILIESAGKHWLSLQIDHPIKWEGAIDTAMEAACSHIKELEQKLETLNDAGLEVLDALARTTLPGVTRHPHMDGSRWNSPNAKRVVEAMDYLREALEAEGGA